MVEDVSMMDCLVTTLQQETAATRDVVKKIWLKRCGCAAVVMLVAILGDGIFLEWSRGSDFGEKCLRCWDGVRMETKRLHYLPGP